MVATLRVAAASLLLLSAPALACSCLADEGLVAWLERGGWQGQEVFVGRVVRLIGPHEADIEVVEAVAGTGGVKRLRALDTTACATIFRPDEHYIYFPVNGSISMCSRLPASAEYIKRMRALGRQPKSP